MKNGLDFGIFSILLVSCGFFALNTSSWIKEILVIFFSLGVFITILRLPIGNYIRLRQYSNIIYFSHLYFVFTGLNFVVIGREYGWLLFLLLFFRV